MLENEVLFKELMLADADVPSDNWVCKLLAVDEVRLAFGPIELAIDGEVGVGLIPFFDSVA